LTATTEAPQGAGAAAAAEPALAATMAAGSGDIVKLEHDDQFWANHYEKGETIGRGHFAKVKLVRHKRSLEFFAAKILDKRLEEHEEDYDSMMREFQVLKSLDHPNIVRLHEAFESHISLILVCQLATGGELMHRIAEQNDVYTETEARKHIKTILVALAFMHEKGVVHRDLKPENILLSDKSDDAQILIADFGLGRFIGSQAEVLETVCGTHHYLAPELVKCDRGELSGYSKAVDVWGVGLIAYIMLFGFNPFLRESNMQTHEAIVTCKYSFPKEENISKSAKELIKKMICLSAEKRITIPEAIKNSWFEEATVGGGLTVGKSDVKSVMKEFNARRAVMKLTGMRSRGRRGSDAEDTGDGDGGTVKKKSPAAKKPTRRRSSNAQDTIAAIQAAEKLSVNGS